MTLGAATRINSGTGNLDLSNSGTITGSGYGLTVGGAGNTVIESIIGTGSGSVTKDGDGTLTLTGSNTYTGATLVSAGVMNIQNATALGTSSGGTTVAGGAALQLAGSIAVYNETLMLSGTGLTNTGALRNMSDDNEYQGLITLGAATRINSDDGTLTLSNTGTITGSGFGLTVGGNGDTTINSIIGTGSGTLTKDGGGTLTLAGANTYTGTTTISACTLQLGNGGDTGSLSASSAIVENATLAFNRANTLTQGTHFSSVISGSGGVIQAGSGTTILNGTNTYAGTTHVTAGALFINGNQSAATGAVTVSSGATLGGIGTVGGNTVIEGGGFHTPGATSGAIGTQTFSGSLTFNSGSTFVWDLSAPGSSGTMANQGTYDQVSATGAISVESGAIFKIDVAGATFDTSFWDSTRTWDNVFTGSGTPHLFDGGDTTFTGFSGTGDQVAYDGTVAGQGRFFFTGSTLNWTTELTAIPETANLISLGCLVGAGVFLRSRRRTS